MSFAGQLALPAAAETMRVSSEFFVLGVGSNWHHLEMGGSATPNSLKDLDCEVAISIPTALSNLPLENEGLAGIAQNAFAAF
jgi:hypothetical protein